MSDGGGGGGPGGSGGDGGTLHVWPSGACSGRTATIPGEAVITNSLPTNTSHTSWHQQRLSSAVEFSQPAGQKSTVANRGPV